MCIYFYGGFYSNKYNIKGNFYFLQKKTIRCWDILSNFKQMRVSTHREASLAPRDVSTSMFPKMHTYIKCKLIKKKQTNRE